MCTFVMNCFQMLCCAVMIGHAGSRAEGYPVQKAVNDFVCSISFNVTNNRVAWIINDEKSTN